MGLRVPFERVGAGLARLRFERIAEQIGRLPFDRVGTGIKRIRLDRLTLRRTALGAESGLGPIRLDRGVTVDATPKWRVSLDRMSAAASAGLARLPLDRASTAASAGLSRIPLHRLGPVARVDRRVLAVLSVLAVASFYGLFFASPASHQLEQIAAAQTAAMKPAPKPAAPAANPFDQSRINGGLRALRKTVGPGDQARSLLILGDGTLGTTIVREGSWENVMVRGADTVVEPLHGEPTGEAKLDLAKVHGTAITRMLDAAKTTFALPNAKLASLRLTEHPSNAGTFIWTGTWNDAERTTLYADREAQSVSTTLPR